jgi:hypothetical protein
MLFSAEIAHNKVQGDVNPIHLMLARDNDRSSPPCASSQRFHTIIHTFVFDIVFFTLPKSLLSAKIAVKSQKSASLERGKLLVKRDVFALIDLSARGGGAESYSIDIYCIDNNSKQHVNGLSELTTCFKLK